MLRGETLLKGGKSQGAPPSVCITVTPHAQRERGKVIGLGVLVYIYICVCGQKKFESYFSDRLTFSNIRGRLVLALLSLETLSSLSK